MRKIIHIPIAHSYEEMCAFANIAGKKPERYEKREDAINKYLESIEAELKGMRIDRIYADTIYQDTEKGRKGFVEHYSKIGSKAHKIIVDLIQKGATLERTEDNILILEEHSWLHQYKKGNISFDLLAEFENENMKDRDEFIGKRIDETLKDGECGALFIGGNHNVILQEDIEVKSFKLPEMLLKNYYQRKS